MEEGLGKATTLEPGAMLDGKYRVVRPLGEGGMGIVYEAQHPLLQKTVAIKVLRPELAQIEERRERFEAEARATAALGHPNIVTVSDMGQTPDGALYFVMDRLNGETLADRLSRCKKLDIRSAALIALDVLSGLEAAHASMLVHRDLKPDNIFLAQSPGGREIAKILDFGVAKALAGTGKRKTGTQVGFTLGTPMYMAPEQALADANIDARADLWALGVIVYEMISGRRPFDSEDSVEVLTQVVTNKRAPLADVCPEAPPGLVELVESALSGERAKRPPSAAEFAARLQQVVFGSATPITALRTGARGASAPELGALERPQLVELEPAAARRPSAGATPAPVARPARPSAAPVSASAAPEEPPAQVMYQPEDWAPRRRRGRAGKLVAGVAALALAGGAAAFLLRGRSRVLDRSVLEDPAAAIKGLLSTGKKAAHPTEKPNDVVWVTFNVVPAESRIYVDGKPIPSNPAPLSRGQIHNVTAIADGYEIEQMDITGTSVGTIHLRLEKKKSRRR